LTYAFSVQSQPASAEAVNRHSQRAATLFSGAVFLVLMGFAATLGFACMQRTLAGVEALSADSILRGKWSPKFEKSLGEVLPVSAPSRGLWGQVEYALFHQGRKGVFIGANGWLFTDQELSCPPQYARNMQDNLDFIAQAREKLAASGAKLAVVLVPAKARAVSYRLGAELPSCRTGLYGQLRDSLVARGIPVADLLSAMQSSVPDELYLRTDTHWTPQGARLAAGVAGKAVRAAYPDLALPVQKFSSHMGDIKAHEGDLLRYVPGVEIRHDRIESYTTEAPVLTASAGQGLFGDDSAPQVTLVGTSYSANAKWNFAGFLKESLKADVLNAAEEGQGPFAVMDKYLQADTWKASPPRLVVWEMPERYFLMPHGVAD
jgi:alginate O-acetyltransferase complex protein AlgJ